MSRWRQTLLLLASALLASAGAASADEMPLLRSKPGQPAQALPPGISSIGKTALVFVPPGAEAPMPLVVMLHGAGGDPRSFLDGIRPSAERLGCAVLVPKSAAGTWDIIAERRFGTDVTRIDAALAELFGKAPIDRERIVLAGFSDGASYALSLGLANPQLFRGIVAMSPGFVTASAKADASQRVFVAHGRRDQVLPFSNVTRSIVPALEAAGARPRVHWFAGGHAVDPAILDEGLTYALRRGLG